MNNVVSIVLLLIIFSFGEKVVAQDKLKLVVHAGEYDRTNCIVTTPINNLPTDQIRLFEIIKGKKCQVPCQVKVTEGKVVLFWILNGSTPAGVSRTFVTDSKKKQKTDKYMSVCDKNGNLTLQSDGIPVLQYNCQTVYPPQGIDTAYRRSGFVHPVWSPSGNVLTAIQPKDHYHHYGIWNPWTRVEYAGKEYDLWNLKDKKGTVRFSRVRNTEQGAVFASFTVQQDHYIMNLHEEKKIMEEACCITAYNTGNSFLWDFESELHPDTPYPVLLKAYRYAGFGYRATQLWTKDNCEMLTSENKTRQEIDGTTARWIYITGQCEKGRSGLLFLGHPDNFNAPQPLRIWDKKANGGRGDAFINFASTKNTDWKLEAGNYYHLRYRVLAYDGEMNQETANNLWNDFAYPPQVSVEIL